MAEAAKASNTLFRTVFRQLVENFTPRITQKLSEYEFLKDAMGKEDALISILRCFPSTSKEYISLIDTVVGLASCNPAVVLDNVLDFGRQIAENNRNSMFIAILSLLPLYNSNICEHRLLLHHTWLYCISDLVMRIVEDRDVTQMHDKIMDLFLLIDQESCQIETLFEQILGLWSVTVAFVGNAGGMATVTHAFEEIVRRGKRREALKLVQYITIKNEGFDQFKAAVIAALKCDEVDCATDLVPLEKLIVGCEKDENFLNEVLECVHHDITIETLVRMLLSGTITAEFVESRIMGVDPPSVRALFWAMTGPHVPKQHLYQHVFHMDVVLKSLDEGLGQWDDADFVINGFMKYFFERASFGENHWIYIFIIISLALRHFDCFMERVVPPFAALPASDSRATLMLMALKELNQMTCFTKEQLHQLNNAFRAPVRAGLSVFPETLTEKAVLMGRDDELLGPIINDHTQAIALFLESIKNDIFEEIVCSFLAARQPDSNFSFEILIVQASEFILTEEDRLELFAFWLELTCHPSIGISEAAYSFCLDLVQKYASQLIPTLVKIAIETESEEKLFHLMKLANHIVLKCDTLTDAELADLEFMAMVSSVTVHPEVRIFALYVIERIGIRSKKRSLYQILKENKKPLENTIKRRIILTSAVIKFLESGKPIVQNGELGVRLVCGSYFYDVWLLVLSEIMKLLICVNWSPILERVQQHLSGSRSFRCLFLFALSAYYFPVFDALVFPYKLQEEGRPEPSDEMQVKLFQVLVNLIEDGRTEHALKIIQGVHFSFYATVTQVLPCVGEDFIPEAASILVVFLRSPEVTPQFIGSMLVFVLQFVQVVQNYLVQHELNGPRVISWDKESERLLLKHETTILNYIIIIIKALPDTQVSEEEWPIAARDLTFRYMLNWALTKGPELATIRDYAMNGIVTISKVGTIFTDSLLFDRKVVKLFGKYERKGFSFVQCLLFYHTELLLDIFMVAYFCQPRRIADCYLESLLVLTGTSQADIIYQASGQFLLLLFVLRIRQHILADELLDFFLRTVMTKQRKLKVSYTQILKRFETEPDFLVIPEVFSYATEGVFDFAFTLLGQKLHVSVGDICDALVPWIANLRLLPKRSQCASDVTAQFNCFTPYQFLMKFMEMSAVVKDDHFLNVTTLWTELMRSPDHAELIPLFFMSWPEAPLKKKIFDLMLRNDPVGITKRLAQHCTFAYYYHVTNCLEKAFDDEWWVLKVMFEGFHRYWADVSEEVINVIHFAYLFRFHETADLFELICTKLEVDMDDEETLLKRIIEKLDNSEEWGNEALKWVVGSRSTKFASISLQIYNQIQKPAFEPDLLAKVVMYHLQHSPTEVADLILESFVFFANNFTGNEEFAFNYLVSFLDSPVYCSTFSGLILKLLPSEAIGRKAWSMIIPIVKPMLGHLEGNESLSKMFDLFIRTSHNEELMLITAPLKDLEPSQFPSSPPTSELMKTVRESTMCKCLMHYANMISTVSVRLVNAIFRVATLILDKVPSHENNLCHLAKLYSYALHTLSQCPNAIPYITHLMRKEPAVAMTSYIDVSENERSLEDVERSLERLARKDEDVFVLGITDCKSYANVVGFPESTSKPKILPFVTRQEMIDGMQSVTKITNIRKTLSLRRLNGVHSTATSLIRSTVMSLSSMLNNSVADFNSHEMFHPKRLNMAPIEEKPASSMDLIYTPEMFLSALTL